MVLRYQEFFDDREMPRTCQQKPKRTIRRLANGFFFSRDVLYKRTLDLNLLICVDAEEAEKIMNEVHAGVCGPHMNGYVLAKKDTTGGVLLAYHGKGLLSLFKKMSSISNPW